MFLTSQQLFKRPAAAAAERGFVALNWRSVGPESCLLEACMHTCVGMLQLGAMWVLNCKQRDHVVCQASSCSLWFQLL
jgi:hypothetical protein